MGLGEGSPADSFLSRKKQKARSEERALLRIMPAIT